MMARSGMSIVVEPAEVDIRALGTALNVDKEG